MLLMLSYATHIALVYTPHLAFWLDMDRNTCASPRTYPTHA